MLGRFRRDRPRTDDTDGCDPALFAEQIGQYLRRARQSRSEGGHQPKIQPIPLPIGGDDELPEPLVAPEPLVIPEPLAAQVVPNLMTEVEEPEAKDLAVTESVERDVDLSELLDQLSTSAPVPVAPPSAAVPRAIAPPRELAAPRAIAPSRSIASLRPVAPLRGRTKSIEPPSQPAWIDADIVDAAVVESPEPIPVLVPAVVPPPRVSEAPPGTFQQLITLPGDNGAQVQASVNVSVAVAVQVSATTATATPAAKRRATTPKPVQDEWGFFDPDQCGFRALLARLDAIAEVEEAD
jgi:nicotinate-nucleotide--dimethylbenzimidazole phosphoribosyltransferase